jgi:predicted ATP-dependent protease
LNEVVDNPRIRDDPQLRAQRIVELFLRERKSEEDIEELSYLLFMFFDVGEFRKFIRHLKDYEMSEEEEAVLMVGFSTSMARIFPFICFSYH